MHRRPHLSAWQTARAIIAGAALVAVPLLTSRSVLAAEFCVSCETPSAHYTCVLPGPAADPSDSRLKLWCMTELAKAGNHASCTIDRQQQRPCDGTIKTIERPPGYELGPAPTAPEASTGDQQLNAPQAMPAQPQQQPPLAPAASATKPPPKGVSGEIVIPKSPTPTAPSAAPSPAPGREAAETTGKPTPDNKGSAADTAKDAVVDAAEAAGSAVDKAGKAVGNAAQKTWTCITSLFGDC